MPAVWSILVSLGKWRYFLTGVPMAALLGLTVRAIGKLLTPFGERRSFRGTVEQKADGPDGMTDLLIRFQDASRLRHTAALRTADRAARGLMPGDSAGISVRTEIFAAGSYPQSLSEITGSGDVILRQEARRLLIRRLLRTLTAELLICGAALAVFLTAMHFCFP